MNDSHAHTHIHTSKKCDYDSDSKENGKRNKRDNGIIIIIEICAKSWRQTWETTITVWMYFCSNLHVCSTSTFFINFFFVGPASPYDVSLSLTYFVSDVFPFAFNGAFVYDASSSSSPPTPFFPSHTCSLFIFSIC